MKDNQVNHFYEPGCTSCDFLKEQGAFPCETRYCTNFPRKRAKRFRSRDPILKAPAWCPKRNNPPILRVYGFLDSFSWRMEALALPSPLDSPPEYTYPNRCHYKIRVEKRTGSTAKDFYSAVKKGEAMESLLEVAVEDGEVIEIDSGLKSFYFQYLGMDVISRVPFFEQIERRKPPKPGTDNTGTGKG